MSAPNPFYPTSIILSRLWMTSDQLAVTFYTIIRLYFFFHLAKFHFFRNFLATFMPLSNNAWLSSLFILKSVALTFLSIPLILITVGMPIVLL